MLFSEKLRLLREAKGLTQAQLAEKVNVSRALISLYEAGSRKVAVDDVPALAEALEVDDSFFHQQELWAEVEAALAQAKRILADAKRSAPANATAQAPTENFMLQNGVIPLLTAPARHHSSPARAPLHV